MQHFSVIKRKKLKTPWPSNRWNNKIQ